MKYFYIHYGAIGNAIMMCVSMRKHILNKKYDWKNVRVHCAHSYVKEILKCIPELPENNINVQNHGIMIRYERFQYTWEAMKEGKPEIYLNIPEDYKEKFKVNAKTICFHVREDNIRKDDAGWLADHNYYKHEPERFVKSEPYIKLAMEYASKGYNIIVLGDKGSTSFPIHENIFNLCHMDNKGLIDDFYAIARCDYVVASTSCMQVAGRAFNKCVLHTDNVHPYKRWWFGDINLFKKLVHKESGHIVSNQEFIDTWGLDPFKISNYPARTDEYELIDCTYEELKTGLEGLIDK